MPLKSKKNKISTENSPKAGPSRENASFFRSFQSMHASIWSDGSSESQEEEISDTENADQIQSRHRNVIVLAGK